MVLGVVPWWAEMPRQETVSCLADRPKPWMVSCQCLVPHGTSDNTTGPMRGLLAMGKELCCSVLRMGYWREEQSMGKLE